MKELNEIMKLHNETTALLTLLRMRLNRYQIGEHDNQIALRMIKHYHEHCKGEWVSDAGIGHMLQYFEAGLQKGEE